MHSLLGHWAAELAAWHEFLTRSAGKIRAVARNGKHHAAWGQLSPNAGHCGYSIGALVAVFRYFYECCVVCFLGTAL